MGLPYCLAAILAAWAAAIADVVMSEVVTTSPREFGNFIRAEVARWRDVINKTGMRED